LTSKRSSVRI